MNIYFFGDTFRNRLSYYKRASRKVMNRGQKVLLLLPDHAKVEYARQFFPENSPDLIIGTRSALFSPLENLGLIILDEDDHFAYFEERSPFFHAKTIALKIARSQNWPLLIGNLIPTVATLFLIQSKKAKALKEINFQTFPPLLVKKLYSEEKEFLSAGTISLLKKSVEERQKIAFIIPRLENYFFVCRDCGFFAQETPLSLVCPKCQGNNLKTKNSGRADWQNYLKEKLGKEAASIQIENKKILTPPEVTYDTVVVPANDWLFSLPDFRLSESLLFFYLKLWEKTKKNLILETQTENPLLEALKKRNPGEAISKILQERKELFFPPFSSLIRLLGQESGEEKLKKEGEKIYQGLLSAGIESSCFEIFPAAPCEHRQKRGKYRWQIVLKIKPGKETGVKKTLLKIVPTSWKIMVDPLNLM
ncbi:hypothetical protein HYU72_01470 [Candidatus Berkelbacteria bacterium]|nr:hypothetical protein [Candidatus Berkelbacteria bacterium]